MITIQKTITLPDTYPLERLGRLEDLLFFDIETTGFSGDYTHLYLIGCTYFQKGTWHLIQWFADTADSEAEILHSFFHFLEQFKTVVHFNGDGFDIPYLLKRCKAFKLPYNFSGVSSIDIYKKIKPFRSLLKLEQLKQKSIERFLGIYREDQYHGGQLIDVYKIYLQTHEDELYDMLMLHNREDLEGMPLILPILNYPDFFEHPFLLKNETVLDDRVILQLENPVFLPVSCACRTELGCFSADGQKAVLEIPLYRGVLKHFYENYKDYYYLIYEDTAVHKSIGEFVEKSARRKATAKTCYTKKEGSFFPLADVWDRPMFQEEYHGKLLFGEYTDGIFECPGFLEKYIKKIAFTK